MVLTMEKKWSPKHFCIAYILLKAYIIISSGKEQAELSPGEDMDWNYPPDMTCLVSKNKSVKESRVLSVAFESLCDRNYFYIDLLTGLGEMT